MFSLLHEINYHYNKGSVCCILPLYSHYRYVELSILFLFVLFIVIIATVSNQYYSYLYYRKIHLRGYIHCYRQLTHDCFVILNMFYFKLSWNFDFLTNIESVHLWVFLTQLFRSRLRNPLPSIFDHQQQVHKSSSCYQTKLPLKEGALLGVHWSWWRRSWLRLKYPGFR